MQVKKVMTMTYDHELILIGHIYEEDEWGNQVPVETRKPVLCNIKSIGRNEFYNAAMTGLKPSIIFVIHGYEYEGEQEVEFEGEIYKVIRTYATGFEEIELTCEKVAANG